MTGATVRLLDFPPPAAVTDLRATVIGGGEVRLEWTRPSGPIDGYRLERYFGGSPDSPNHREVASPAPGPTATSYVDLGLTSFRYQYRLYARNDSGESNGSNRAGPSSGRSRRLGMGGPLGAGRRRVAAVRLCRSRSRSRSLSRCLWMWMRRRLWRGVLPVRWSWGYSRRRLLGGSRRSRRCRGLIWLRRCCAVAGVGAFLPRGAGHALC